MTLNEAIAQMKDLRKNQESFLDGKYNVELDKDKDEFKDNPFVLDMIAIDKVLEMLGVYALHNQELKKMLKAAVNEMQKGNKCNPKGFLFRYGEEAQQLIRIDLNKI